MNNFQKLYHQLIPEDVYTFYESLLNTIISEEDIVVDVGCGSGRLTKRLERLTNHVFAFDLDQNMIDIAKKASSHATFKIHDMHLPWPFYGDIICLTLDVLNYSQTPILVLQHAIDALSDEGIILMDIYNHVKTYSESNTKPFPYTWYRKVTGNKILHELIIENNTYLVHQTIHPIHIIVEFLEKQGFNVDILAFISEEKKVLIARR